MTIEHLRSKFDKIMKLMVVPQVHIQPLKPKQNSGAGPSNLQSQNNNTGQNLQTQNRQPAQNNPQPGNYAKNLQNNHLAPSKAQKPCNTNYNAVRHQQLRQRLHQMQNHLNMQRSRKSVRQRLQQMQNQLNTQRTRQNIRTAAPASHNNVQTNTANMTSQTQNQNNNLAKINNIKARLVQQLVNNLKGRPSLLRCLINIWRTPGAGLWGPNLNLPVQHQRDIVKLAIGTFIKSNPDQRKVFIQNSSVSGPRPKP